MRTRPHRAGWLRTRLPDGVRRLGEAAVFAENGTPREQIEQCPPFVGADTAAQNLAAIVAGNCKGGCEEGGRDCRVEWREDEGGG